MRVTLIESGTSPDPVKAIALAASKCYDSDPDKKLVERVLKSGHTSIAEHAKFEFDISEVSRVLSHQLVRKRIGFSYSQRSQRYCNEHNYDYTVPDSIRESNFLDEYVDKMEDLANFYTRMVEDEIPKEDARFALPNATHTTLILSNNLRSLMDFCHERLCSRAQWEIREMANKISQIIDIKWPVLGQFLRPKCKDIGYCPEYDSCGRMPKKEDVL